MNFLSEINNPHTRLATFFIVIGAGFWLGSGINAYDQVTDNKEFTHEEKIIVEKMTGRLYGYYASGNNTAETTQVVCDYMRRNSIEQMEGVFERDWQIVKGDTGRGNKTVKISRCNSKSAEDPTWGENNKTGN